MNRLCGPDRGPGVLWESVGSSQVDGWWLVAGETAKGERTTRPNISKGVKSQPVSKSGPLFPFTRRRIHSPRRRPAQRAQSLERPSCLYSVQGPQPVQSVFLERRVASNYSLITAGMVRFAQT